MNILNAHRTANQLLAGLPDSDYEKLLPHLEFISLSQHQVLGDVGESLEYAYFPVEAVISLLSVMEDGSMVEAVVVGNEGMVGIPIALGTNVATVQAVVQISGLAMRMRAEQFKAEFDRGGALKDAVLQHIQVVFIHVTRLAACNRLHRLENRLARWLLTFQDRMESNELPLTQEFIAHMLGTRRAGVTMAINNLRKEGILQCNRGHITVLDRSRLEAASCECYRRINLETQQILARSPDKVSELV
jgi:CRP-like cAMP-binding protein